MLRLFLPPDNSMLIVKSVFFNRGSVEPKGSTDLFQGFRDVPGKKVKIT